MLRQAEEADLDAIRAWRNQPANQQVSIQQHEISAEEHRAWWERVQADPTRQCLIFESGGRPLGVVNFFDLATDEAGERTGAWGFFLDTETTTAEGTAMTAWMQVMREATDHAFAAAPEGLGLDVLHGEVRPDNEAVRMMNRRFRFAEGTPYDVATDAGPVTLIPITLRSTDRRTRKARA